MVLDAVLIAICVTTFLNLSLFVRYAKSERYKRNIYINKYETSQRRISELWQSIQEYDIEHYPNSNAYYEIERNWLRKINEQEN